jgi:hypothetical protein
MHVTAHSPIIMNVDNQGSIFLAMNESTTRTKHIDVRHHFLRDLVDGPNPTFKLNFVRSEKNKADPHTKNLPVHLFKRAFLEDRLIEKID